MQLIVTKDYDEMSAKSLDILVAQLKEKPDSVIGFTTGASPEGLTKGLADAINNGLDISAATFLNLDEFIGDPDGAYSVKRFMYDFLYNQIKVQPKNIFLLDGAAPDKEAEVKRYTEILSRYPRDIQFLGLGINGHIGANEPGTPFDSTFFVSDMAESTFVKTMKQFGLTEAETPRQMFTMGFSEIMAAKKVVLQVSGVSKAQAVKNMIENEVSVDCPASFLKTHPDFVCVCDEDAVSLLEKQ